MMIKRIRTGIADFLLHIHRRISDEPERLLPSSVNLHDQGDLDTIKCLQMDIAYFEKEIGENMVRDERYLVKRSLTSIAKRHLKEAKGFYKEGWIYQSRALVRHFSKTQEKDAKKAIDLLMPFELRYQQACLVGKKK